MPIGLFSLNFGVFIACFVFGFVWFGLAGGLGLPGMTLLLGVIVFGCCKFVPEFGFGVLYVCGVWFCP